MKFTKLITFFLFFALGCGEKGYSDESVILFETNEYIIYTTKDYFKEDFENFIEKNKNGPFIEIDKKLYLAIRNHFSDRPVNAFLISDQLKRGYSLSYRTVDLLQYEKAFVLNKMTKKNEDYKVTTYRHTGQDGREVIVKDNVLLEVVDIMY